MGTLYYGDNLEIIKKYIKPESVDLIYLDPPFNSKANYNVLFKHKDDTKSPAQIKAFADSWEWCKESAKYYHETITGGGDIAQVINSLKEVFGTNDLMAYLVMMSVRLVELHKVLKDTGSCYLHCDPTASHYLKFIMDAIFGVKNYRNEIIWKRHTHHSDGKRYGKITDTILFYTKTNSYTWNKIYIPYTKEYVKTAFRHEDERGYFQDQPQTADSMEGGGYEYEFHGHKRIWQRSKKSMLELEKNNMLYFPKKKGSVPRLKIYLEDSKGIPLQNIWTDIPIASGKERLGYQTQKPIALLERIIQSSSNKDDVVLDPFCGCGTAIHAAQKLQREWIGIDITYLATSLIEYRMSKIFRSRPTILGSPVTINDAKKLASDDPFQFEIWAVTRIDGLKPNKSQVGDKGIDGVGFIPVDKTKNGVIKYGKLIASVKSGENLNPGMVRDFIGTVKRENAKMGIFVCLEPPTSGMKKEAATGEYFTTSFNISYPKIQIYTIKDYFDGKKPALPEIAFDLDVKSDSFDDFKEQSKFD